MDFLLLLLIGCTNVVIVLMAMNATAPIISDPNYWIGLILAFVTGYGLSIIRDIRKNNFTVKTSVVKFFASLFLCYLGYMAKDHFPSKLEYLIAAISFGSLYIVDALEKIFSLGLPRVAQLLIQNLSNYLDKSKTTSTREEDNL